MIVLNVARPAGEADPVELADAALAAGLDGVALADSPRLFPDCLVETERVLAATAVRVAGPCVLSLGLRHPATVAGAVRTLDAHHPGRVLAVVGRGESSVRNEGLTPPSLRTYEAALDTLRELAPASALLLGAASGPRTVAATAARLGGVLVDAGADPAIVGKAVALARSARADVRVWMFVRAVVTDDEAGADDAAAPVLGSCAARLAQAPDWFDVPAALRPAVTAVAEAHDYRRHGTAGARAGGDVPAEADRFVRERFVVTGDPRAVADRFAAFAAAGVDGVVLAGALDGVRERLDDLGRAVRDGMTGDGR
ncbi:LLM class flavin-dependent oxidoreductase [Micromonospora humi]|uniref:Methylenetetrahydromethanopterin reductase n=1 Tax=Micromonospora humi TaxID=745366 RepID=A0A1C5JCY8_9ACTN|nr:LLM class flavin-dependent oxidoreductase [Micromonospora humi]SCG68069.1 methylenetetrahydromethanopterin reductase [Micromonospora humi]